MNLFWLLRMKRWAQNPPSPKTLKLIAAIVIASFTLYFFEQSYGWPEWLTVNKTRR